MIRPRHGVLLAIVLAAAAWMLVARSGRCDGLPPLPAFPTETMEPEVREQFAMAEASLRIRPCEAERNARLGMLYHAYGFLAHAEACYRRATELGREPSPWRPHLARVLLERGAFDQASAEFTAVLDAGGGDAVTRYYLAEAQRQVGEHDGALANYAAAPGIPQALCGTGRVHAARGELDAAEAALRQALAAAPDYGAARYALGQVLRRMGRTQQAESELARAQQDRDREPPLPDPLMEGVTGLRRGAVDALHRGIELLASGDVALATALLEQAVATDPALVEAHSQLGAARLSAGDLDGAESSLRRAIELDPDFVDAWYNLGVAAHRRGDHAGAVECFQRAVALRPRHADALLGLGTDLPQAGGAGGAGAGRAAEAVEYLRRAVEVRPEDARGHKRLGALLSQLGRHQEAIAALRAGCARLPADASIVERLAWTLATCPDAQVRDPAEAQRLARDAMERTGGTVPQVLDTLAAALAASGRFPDAIETASRARELAVSGGRTALAAEIEARLDGYRRGEPFLDPAQALESLHGK